jgi:hypothetical protein
MKLADALLIRSDINKKLASLTDRIKGNCRIQDGEEPGEDPQKLMIEAFRLMQDLEVLVGRINRSNLVIKLTSGKTMMEAIAERDRLMSQHNLLKVAANACRLDTNYYSHSEIKWKVLLRVDSLENQADDLSKKIRNLNSAIQEANWNNELAEE